MYLEWKKSAFPRYANLKSFERGQRSQIPQGNLLEMNPKTLKNLPQGSERLCCLETRSVCLMFCIMSYPLWNLCCRNVCMYDDLHWTCRPGRLPLLQRIGVIYLQLTVDDNEVLVRWVTGLLFSQEESQWGSSLLAHCPSGSPIMFNKECKSTVSY